ncbi:MAG: hypothetical protein ACMG6E_10080 [Candidatus Roizmanbacteria bacterium]
MGYPLLAFYLLLDGLLVTHLSSFLHDIHVACLLIIALDDELVVILFPRPINSYLLPMRLLGVPLPLP